MTGGFRTPAQAPETATGCCGEPAATGPVSAEADEFELDDDAGTGCCGEPTAPSSGGCCG
ncbi:hypothetical protein [Sphaerisporangium flaviroseum]